MEDLLHTIKEYFDDYLILDGLVPTISLGYIKEELVLHNIATDKYVDVLKCFFEITQKDITEDYLISELSHGQQLILSAIIALSSNANSILFNNFFTSISSSNTGKIMKLIDIEILKGRKIVINGEEDKN
jgi:ABC-type Mn2+/Zn2+ transport system ATPase subunit